MSLMCCLPWCRRHIRSKRKCRHFPSDRPTQLTWLDTLEMGAWFSIPPETLSSSLLLCENHFDKKGSIKPKYEILFQAQTPLSIKMEPTEILSDSQSDVGGSDDEDGETNVDTKSGESSSNKSLRRIRVNIVKVEDQCDSRKQKKITSSSVSSSSESEAVLEDTSCTHEDHLENDESNTDLSGMGRPGIPEPLTKSTSSNGKQSRTALNLLQKMKIIRMVDEGVSQTQIARKLNLKRSTVWSTIAARNKIEEAFNSGAPLRKRLRKGTYDDINEALYSWYQTVTSQNVYVNTKVVMTMAENIASQLGKNDFKGSQAWLERFKQRYNIKFNSNNFKVKKAETVNPVAASSTSTGNCENTYCSSDVPDVPCTNVGESKEGVCKVDESVLTSKDWIKYNWPKFRVKDKKAHEVYHEKDIFFAKEVGILYRMSPRTAYEFRTNASLASQFSIVDERIMVLLCANGDGSEKRKLLLIGGVHSSMPNNLPVDCVTTSDPVNGITKAIFANWLNTWNNELQSQNRRIILLLDSSPLHVFSEHLPNIKFVNIPTHHLSLLHPVNLGISANFRSRYRRLLLEKLVNSGNRDVITCRDAAFLLNTAWNEVPSSLVKDAYQRGFANSKERTKFVEQTEFDCSDLMAKAALLGLAVPLSKYSFTNYVDIDNSLCAVGCTVVLPEPESNDHDDYVPDQIFADVVNDGDLEINDEFMQQMEFVPTQSMLSSADAQKRLGDLRNWVMAKSSCPQEVHNALSTVESFILGHI